MKIATVLALSCALSLVIYVVGFGSEDNTIDDGFPNIVEMVVTTTEAPAATEPPRIALAATCEAPYVLNPISSTCLRVGPRQMKWAEAKDFCVASGERLAVFESAEAQQWFEDYVASGTTPADWDAASLSWYWLGMGPVGGVWKWQGRVDSVVGAHGETWGSNQPAGSDDTFCGAMTAHKHRPYFNKLWAWSCTYPYNNLFADGNSKEVTTTSPATTTVTPVIYQAWLQRSVRSYLRARNLPAMDELTACFYFEPSSKLTFHDQWLLSIASAGYDNGFLLGFKNEYLRLYSCQDETDGNNLGKGADALAAFTEAHRHCFVFGATTLKWFYDKTTPGILELITTSNHDGTGGCWIEKGASLVPLNDQDSVGGWLQEEQQTPGVIADLQVWDRALSDSEITQDLGCHAQGNVVKFEDLEVVGVDHFQPAIFKCTGN